MKREGLYLRSIALRGLPEFIRDLGGSPENLFTASKLNIADIENNNFYDWSNACNLLERAASDLNQPSFGIKWAHSIPKDFLNSGPMLLLAGLTPNIRSFFDLAIEYQKLHTNGIYYSYSENHENNELECNIHVHPSSPPCRQFSEHIMALLFIAERQLINKGNFSTLTFQHNASMDISWHEKTFKCPIVFNNEKTKTLSHIGYLDTKIDGRLKVFQPILRGYLKRQTEKNTLYKSSISATIAQILPTIFGMRLCKLNQIAQLLDLSPKKLQRLLKEEDTHYSDILDTVRKNTAKRLLFESDISITHLANLLDYSSNEAFNIACKRWFGLSPRQYRQELRGSVL